VGQGACGERRGLDISGGQAASEGAKLAICLVHFLHGLNISPACLCGNFKSVFDMCVLLHVHNRLLDIRMDPFD